MQALAAVLVNTNQPLEMKKLVIPELLEGQVLVKVCASGICHSQLNEIKGKKGPDKYLPHTLGHEGAGVVEAVGPNVTKVQKGDHVVLSWIKGSGVNAPPPIYLSDGQRINSGQLSTFNEWTVAAENRLTRISKEVPFHLAALIGCGIATGMGTIKNIAKIKTGESVAIFGVGGVGLSAVCAASLMGASKIIAVDIKDEKLEKASQLGATHSVHAGKKNVVDVMMKLTEGKGVDYAMESAGQRQTMEQAFQCVKMSGGKAILAGNLSAGQAISIDPFALICGKQIVGSWGGQTNPDHDFPYYADLYLSGRLKLEGILTHRFKLNQINDAFLALERGEVGRAIVKF